MIRSMVTPVVWVNLLFAPAIALWVHVKRHNAKFALSVRLLLQYAIFVACNIPLTKIGIVMIRRLLGREISIDSGYYTLAAIFASALLPGLMDRARNVYRDREKYYKQWKNCLRKHSMTYTQKLPVTLLLILLIVVAYVIRGPLEIYTGNAHEFLFTLGDFLPWLLTVGTVILAVAGCLLALLPDAAFRLTTVLLLWFGVASWVQDLFLNIKLTGTGGGPLDFEDLGSFVTIDLLIWLVLLAGTVFLCVRFKKSWFSSAKLIAGALCLIQVIAIGSVLLTMPEQKSVGQLMSGETELQLASEENVIVLVIDSVGIDNIENMMEQYPEAAAIVKDFTYFDNVCSDYYCTYPSITHFLTGNEMDFSLSPEVWLRESWNSDRCKRFFDILKEAGYVNRIYSEATYSNYVYGGIENLVGKFENIEEVQMQITTSLLLEKLLNLSAFRYLPYIWKAPFEVLTSEFNDVAAPIEMRVPSYENEEFYQYLTETKLSTDTDIQKLFHVQYLKGMHYPWQTSANATYKDGASSTETLRGTFTIMQTYFDQMKSLGIYDDATIVVMADHCPTYYGRLSCMFYLKRPGESHEATQINHAPVAYQDFQATILELIGCNDGSYGKSFFDWHEGEERRRIIWEQREDMNYPLISGLTYNRYYGYVYYKDAEELKAHIIEDEPDFNLPAMPYDDLHTLPWYN